jgi:hypothetical protein
LESYTICLFGLTQCSHIFLARLKKKTQTFYHTQAAANSFLDFVNVDEGEATISTPHNLHRSKDPGIGGFTIFHSREATAHRNIQAGEELFVSYGSHWYVRSCVCALSSGGIPVWFYQCRMKEHVCIQRLVVSVSFFQCFLVLCRDRFLERTKLGPVPVEGSHAKAQHLYKMYKKLMDDHNETTATAVFNDLWDEFVINTNWTDSRVFASLPPKEDYDEAMIKVGLIEYKTQRMIRSHQWLEENGVCADILRFKESTIPQAGHGAFANRFLSKGSVVLPIPFIHIPDRKVLEMYDMEDNKSGGIKGRRKQKKKNEEDTAKVVGHQLLLNYCLGHADSTMLLSPYGPAFNLINHNQTLANVRLQWADPKRSNFHPELLNESVEHFYNVTSSQLAMELVTLRDISPDEEIFYDYGDAWEAAWHEHVKNWNPLEGSIDYISSEMMNKNAGRLLTEFEQLVTPYPANLGLQFDRTFVENDWKKHFHKGKAELLRYQKKQSGEWANCEILRFKRNVNGTVLYTTTVFDVEEDEFSPDLIKDVPREAFVFVDRASTSDMALPNAFRHDIRIPDELFPEAWKNKKEQAVSEEL